MTAVVDGRIIGGPRNEIKEVLNANVAYGMIDSIDPYSLDDVLKVHGIMMDGPSRMPGNCVQDTKRYSTGKVIASTLHPGPIWCLG